MKRIYSIILAGVLSVCVTSTAGAARTEKPHLVFDHYYNYEELSQALKTLADAYPEFLTLASAGTSFQGRDIWVMTVNNKKTGPDTDKPAMYIDGNIHGNEVQGGEVCLYTIQFLMEQYGGNPKITALVDNNVFYILPTVNPDGRAWWFRHPNTMNSSRSVQRPRDDDNDGVADEDGYDDVDGDGQILMMRKKTAYGNFKQDPADPRNMIRVKPGEKGEYRFLGYEGIDNDGDGRINEDPPGGYDPNRNWPGFDWQPPYVQYGAGEYPMSNPETVVVTDFLRSHPNIAGVQSFHNSGGMILRGPGFDLTKYPRDDVEVYDFIGETGEKILPFYRYMVLKRDLYPAAGGFITFTYETLGIFSFTNELWSTKQYYNKESKRSESYSMAGKERLDFDDLVDMGEQFVEWKPFNHPVYGPVELGGWKKMTGRINPVYLLPELCHRNMAFCLFHAEQMPDVSIHRITAKKLGKDTWEVTAHVVNDGVIPTISKWAADRNMLVPDRISITGKHMSVLSAGIVRDEWNHRVDMEDKRPERIVVKDGIPGLSGRAFQWIVQGGGTIDITFRAEKGGTCTKSMKLK